jgi:hypothetical protein
LTGVEGLDSSTVARPADEAHPLDVHPKDDRPVRAKWNRRFWGFDILAFADRTYLVQFGRDRKPPFLIVGWCRWYPCSVEFPRYRQPGK